MGTSGKWIFGLVQYRESRLTISTMKVSHSFPVTQAHDVENTLALPAQGRQNYKYCQLWSYVHAYIQISRKFAPENQKSVYNCLPGIRRNRVYSGNRGIIYTMESGDNMNVKPINGTNAGKSGGDEFYFCKGGSSEETGIAYSQFVLRTNGYRPSGPHWNLPTRQGYPKRG